MERLNSPLEADPILNMYEDSEGKVMSRENAGIHPEFRLFCAANMKRAHSNQQSPRPS